MSSPVIHFLSPSEFTIDGTGVQDWRASMGVWIEGSEHSKAFQRKVALCDGCTKTCRKQCGMPRQWDGKYYPGKRARNGMLHLQRGLLRKALEDLNATILSLPPIMTVTPPRFTELRDYQNEALEKIFQNRWGRIGLPTNAGKGAIIATSSKVLSDAGCKVLVLCDELSVFSALSQEIQKWIGRPPDVVTADPDWIPTGSVVLGMAQTIHARTRIPKQSAKSKLNPERVHKWRQWLLTFGAVLLDEADKCTAPSWKEILDRLENTHYRIGFSGTFDRKMTPGEMSLAETIGPVFLTMQNSEMIERGVSAKPIVELTSFLHHLRWPPKEELEEMNDAQITQFIYRQGIIENEARHQVVCSLVDPNVQNAIIINYIDQGLLLSARIPDNVFLSGSDDKDYREFHLERFRKGQIQNIIVSKILDRGTNDLGVAVGLVFASGMGSTRQILQRIGRGLRRTGGKEFVFFRDIMDRGIKMFDNQSKKRLELYNEEGFEITIRR